MQISDKIIFIDETHFQPDGSLIIGETVAFEENPQVIHDKAIHPARVSVWCTL